MRNAVDVANETDHQSLLMLIAGDKSLFLDILEHAHQGFLLC